MKISMFVLTVRNKAQVITPALRRLRASRTTTRLITYFETFSEKPRVRRYNLSTSIAFHRLHCFSVAQRSSESTSLPDH